MNTKLILFKSSLMSILCLMLLLSLMSLLSGCGTTQYMRPQPLAPQNSAKIEIVRPSEFWGSGVTVPIYVNNNYIGRVGTGGQLTWVVRPGPITVSTSEGTAVLLVDRTVPHRIHFVAQKGKTYYIKVLLPYQIQFSAPFFGDPSVGLQLMSKR